MNRLQVSDHALLRFLQRGGGMDVEAVRETLAAALARAHAAATEAGGGRYLVVVDGLAFVVRDGVLVTVLEDVDVFTRAQAMSR